MSRELDQLSINTIRTLSMDAVQQARSGHPGTPMALAPLIYTLWNRVMRFDPHACRSRRVEAEDRGENVHGVVFAVSRRGAAPNSWPEIHKEIDNA